MAASVDRHLDQLRLEDGPDRRNGHYRRHRLTRLGDIKLLVPRTRRYCPVEVVRAYARREAEIDRVILAVLGLRPEDHPTDQERPRQGQEGRSRRRQE